MKRFCILLLVIASCTQSAEKGKTSADDFLWLGNKALESAFELTSPSMLETAYAYYDSLIRLYPNSPEAIVADSMLLRKDIETQKLIALVVKNRVDEEKTLQFIRKHYAEYLQIQFLDKGYDIKVIVKGERFDEVYLTYPLFNEAWSRKFETEGFFIEWGKLGFKKVLLSNDHEFTKWVSLR
jgi:hypothetical protein